MIAPAGYLAGVFCSIGYRKLRLDRIFQFSQFFLRDLIF
jgi:hypothetical protein